MLRYLFRKPKFPIICNINNFVFGAKSEKEFIDKIPSIKFDAKTHFDVIDITSEGWLFSPKLMALSPLTLKKKWMKKEIINLVNNRKNKNNNNDYSMKKNMNKRLDIIISELVEYLNE